MEWLDRALGALFGGGVVLLGAMTRFRDSASKRHLSEAAQAVADYKAICDRQETQIARWEMHCEEQQETIRKQLGHTTRCREQMIEMYGFMKLLHKVSCDNHGALVGLGAKVAPVPDLPPLRLDDDEGEFLVRTTEENARLLKESQHENPRS